MMIPINPAQLKNSDGKLLDKLFEKIILNSAEQFLEEMKKEEIGQFSHCLSDPLF